MKKLNLIVTTIAVAALMCLSMPQQAEARPQYLKAFTQKYSKVAEEAMVLKCGVCHGASGKNKKVVSDYGKALGQALGAKNVKGEEELSEALDKAGAKDAGDGKTYKDLLEAGTLPPAAP